MARLLYSSNSPGVYSLLAANTVTITVPVSSSIAVNAYSNFTILAGSAGIITEISSNTHILLRLYSTESARDLDSRLYNEPITNEIDGHLLDLELLAQEKEKTLLAFNSQNSLIYGRVFNLSSQSTIPAVQVKLMKFAEQTINNKWFGSVNMLKIFENSELTIACPQSFLIEGYYGLRTKQGQIVLQTKINGQTIQSLSNITITPTSQNILLSSPQQVLAGDSITFNFIYQSQTVLGLSFSVQTILN